MKRNETTIACLIGAIGFLPVGILLTYFSNSLDGMRHMMPFGVLSIIASLIFLITYIVKRITAVKKEKELQNALINSGISQIDNLAPFEFEEWVARLLKTAGYNAIATKKSGDYGADVIAEKDGIKIAIQVKKFNQPVGIKAVQEVASAMKYYDCHDGWVITSAYGFTTAAHNLAQKNSIKLINRNDLAIMLNKIKNNFQISEPEQIAAINDEYNKNNNDSIETNSNEEYIPIKDFIEKDIVDMIEIVIKEMKEDNYADLKIDTMPYISDIIIKGKDVCRKAFSKMIEENKKKPFDGFAIICLKLAFFIGMGAVYLYKKENSFDTNKIFETISKKRGFLFVDEYVLDSFNMPFNSPKGLTFCNDLHNYSGDILDLYMVETEYFKEDVSNLTKCMLAMYAVGVSYATEILK